MNRLHRLKSKRQHAQQKGEHEAEAGVEFGSLARGRRFTIYPHKYINLDFIKTGDFGAELYTWDEHAPVQRFPKDAIVYPYPERRSEKG